MFFTVSEKKGSMQLRKRRIWRKRQREKESKFGANHLFDCYLAAILSNYWLEHLKKLITGSHRLWSRQTRYQVPLSCLLAISPLHTSGALQQHTPLPSLEWSCLAWRGGKSCPCPDFCVTLQVFFYSISSGTSLGINRIKMRWIQRCWGKGWWESKEQEKGQIICFQFARRFYLCWFTAFLNTTTSEKGIIRRL